MMSRRNNDHNSPTRDVASQRQLEEIRDEQEERLRLLDHAMQDFQRYLRRKLGVTPQAATESSTSTATTQKRPRREHNDDPLTTVVDELFGHSRHALRIMVLKQTSLRLGLHVWQSDTWPQIRRRLAAPKDSSCRSFSQTLVEHVFTNLLRLHDGTVLLESGECRHPGDVRQARRTRYPSRFGGGSSDGGNYPTTDAAAEKEQTSSSSSFRADGYTRLYHTDFHYSGASWDEWMDEVSGLVTRWKRVLRGRSWESVLEAVPKLDMVFQQWETSNLEIRRVFQQLHQTVIPLELARALESAAAPTWNNNNKNNNRNATSRGRPQRVQVQLSLRDKMEFLTVQFRNGDTWNWQRRGHQFQIKDPQGVLPIIVDNNNNSQTLVWDSILALPVNPHDKNATKNPDAAAVPVKKKQRRCVIDDSDEDEKKEINCPTKSSSKASTSIKTTTGLVLEQHKNNKTTRGMMVGKENMESLTALKQQMGVDVQQLEMARETVEAEEAQATREAFQIDSSTVGVDTTDYHHHANDDIEDSFGTASSANNSVDSWATPDEIPHHVARVRRVLKRMEATVASRRQDELSSNEIYNLWDAHDGLREMLMRAGNVFLWWKTDNRQQQQDARSGMAQTRRRRQQQQDAQQRETYLQEAIKYFSEAQEIVALAAGVNDRIIEINNQGVTEEARFCQRNLLLYEGQALTNNGIAQIELWRDQETRGRPNKRHLKKASKDLQEAMTLAQRMRRQCSQDQTEGFDRLEAELDIRKALELETLAGRWRGVALWNLEHGEAALKAFRQISGLMNCAELHQGDFHDEPHVFESELKLCVEQYYSLTTAADLATTQLHRIGERQLKSHPNDAAIVVQTMQTMLHAAAQASQKLRARLSEAPPEVDTEGYLERHEVLESEVLLQSARDIWQWWEKRKDALLTPLVVPPDPRHSTTPTTSLEALSLQDDTTPTCVMTTTTLAAQQRNKRKKSPTASSLGGYSNIRNYSHNDESNESATTRRKPPQRHRKWGDELLPQTTDKEGNLVPLLSYPCIAPEMPAEIAALLRQSQPQ